MSPRPAPFPRKLSACVLLLALCGLVLYTVLLADTQALGPMWTIQNLSGNDEPIENGVIPNEDKEAPIAPTEDEKYIEVRSVDVETPNENTGEPINDGELNPPGEFEKVQSEDTKDPLVDDQVPNVANEVMATIIEDPLMDQDEVPIENGEVLNFDFNVPNEVIDTITEEQGDPIVEVSNEEQNTSNAENITENVTQKIENVTQKIENVTQSTKLVTAEQIKEVLQKQRKLIAEEIKGYKYGKHSNNASSLKDMVPEMGGTPVRSVVVTTWRSGSTFLGDVLNSHPGNWYHYEPLMDFDIAQIRGPPLAKPALKNLKQLLNCNFTGMEQYLEFGKQHTYLFKHNTRLWQQCEAHPNLCWRQEFLSPMCKLFPTQSMKIVRLRLRLAEQLLQDPNLKVRMLLMVRDPRGTMQSRRHRDWCPNNPDCWDPALLCADLAADYFAAVDIAKKYPHQFRVMRYEDLSVEPYRGVKELLSFFNLNFHPAVRLFLDTHTKADVGGVSSTFRDSKAAPFHWRRDLAHEEVQHIQAVCGEAMQLWGYLPAVNASHQVEFNPMSSYRLN